MKLTRVERLIVANQLAILERLSDDTHEKVHYAYLREGLQGGYVFAYDAAIQMIDSDEFTEERCKFVIDVLDMHRALKTAYEALADKSGVDRDLIKFPGFDGNYEAAYLGFCRYFVNQPDEKRFKELAKGDDYNSHMPTLDRYAAMLDEWNRSTDPQHLTKGDIQRISGVKG
jgi:uncharacterized protein